MSSEVNQVADKKNLIDSFHRIHDYLRISITDKCNLRCRYCMPFDKKDFYSQQRLMNKTEIFQIASLFVDYGVKKIRLTGGEPLVRHDAGEIIKMLSGLPVKLCITTNGVLVHQFIDQFKSSGISSVNVSLDSMKADRFRAMTYRDDFTRVFANIHLLISEGFHVKVNMVVMKGINDEEVIDFVKFTEHLPVHIRFIEFMPFDGNAWSRDKLFSYKEMLETIRNNFNIEKLGDKIHSTSKKYRVPGFKGTFAFITTMTTPFCSDCNRLRLTADGKMKNCLFSKGEADLLTPFRNGEDIIPIIKKCVGIKEASLGGQTNPEKIVNRSMILIGG
jgi:cyclic pyranopterin phosphate synthase